MIMMSFSPWKIIRAITHDIQQQLAVCNLFANGPQFASQIISRPQWLWKVYRTWVINSAVNLSFYPWQIKSNQIKYLIPNISNQIFEIFEIKYFKYFQSNICFGIFQFSYNFAAVGE